MALADEIRKVLSDPTNLPSGFLDYIVQHGALNPVPVQSLNAPTVVASGVGSTSNAPTRYVGGTASGAPSSGTYVAGDFVVSHDGHIYICTAGGSPGTWSTWPAQGEITYDQIVVGVGVTSTSSAAPTTIISGSAASYTGVGIYVEMFATSVAIADQTEVSLLLFDGAACIGLVGRFLAATALGAGLLAKNPFYAQVKLTPSAGTHTYSFKAFRSAGTGGATVEAGSGGSPTTNSPAFLRVRYA